MQNWIPLAYNICEVKSDKNMYKYREEMSVAIVF
jgi:hypothetical protein